MMGQNHIARQYYFWYPCQSALTQMKQNVWTAMTPERRENVPKNLISELKAYDQTFCKTTDRYGTAYMYSHIVFGVWSHKSS